MAERHGGGALTTFAPPNWAYQHLYRGDRPVTLCGMSLPSDGFEGDRRLNGTVIYEAGDGFDPGSGPACQVCADRADAIENGGSR